MVNTLIGFSDCNLISLDVFEDPVITFCGHSYCRKCLEEHIKSYGAKQAFCPLCKTPVGKRNFIPDKKAGVLAQVILSIKPIKKIVINETPKKDLLSNRKRKMSEISCLHRTFESKGVLNEIQNEIHSSKKKQEKRIAEKKIILISNMPEEYQHEVDKFCKLYNAKQVKEYNNKITHLVVFPIEQKEGKIIAKRTLKYLTALVQGIWVVGFNWIINSNGYGELKDEEQFEVTGDTYGTNTPRDSRMKNGMKGMLENLSFFVNESSSKRESHISKKEIEDLIRCAGGEILSSEGEHGKYFQITIKSGGDKQLLSKTNNHKPSPRAAADQPISHKWLLDSISKGHLLNYKSYI